MTVRKGVDNIRNRLTEEEVLEIYNDEDHTQHWLASTYKVSQSSINHLKKGRTWSWLTKHGK
jgi:hypothetical protein